jgi:diguanylate cyclase (GGDEF)-like protein
MAALQRASAYHTVLLAPLRSTMEPTDLQNLRQSLLPMLEAAPDEEERLLRELAERRAKGEAVHAALLAVLVNLEFPEAEARRHWRRIREHRTRLAEMLGRDPGLRVSLLDYFANVEHRLRNPKVIEVAAYERTERSAVTDGLTGLFNHAYFLQALRHEMIRSRRHSLKISLVLLDLDDFKKVNDTLGHLEGDRVLARAASLVKESVREIDVAARYGGEEFAVVLPETSRTGAYVVADRVRVRIEQRFRRRRGPRVTVSGGIVTWPDDAATPADMIVKADEGLYRAKAAGKNRIVLAQGERRQHLRVPADHPVTLGAPGQRTSARAKNVSAGGLLLSLKKPVPVGSAVRVVIRAPGAASVDLRGEVVRVDQALPADTARGSAAPGFDVGLRLLDAPAEASELISKPAKA